MIDVCWVAGKKTSILALFIRYHGTPKSFKQDIWKNANKPDMSGIPQTTWPNICSALYEIRIHQQNYLVQWIRSLTCWTCTASQQTRRGSRQGRIRGIENSNRPRHSRPASHPPCAGTSSRPQGWVWKITIGSPLKVLSRDGRVIQILNKLDCTARVRGKQGEWLVVAAVGLKFPFSTLCPVFCSIHPIPLPFPLLDQEIIILFLDGGNQDHSVCW